MAKRYMYLIALGFFNRLNVYLLYMLHPGLQLRGSVETRHLMNYSKY